MKSTKTLKSSLAIATLALFVTANLAMAARDPNQAIVKPTGSYQSLSYAELEAQWWQAMYSMPVVNGQHPLLTGGAILSNDVVFLSAAPAGTSTNGPSTTINVTVPNATAIFVPVVNAECSTIEPEPFHGDTEPELRACANGHIDETSNLSATIDAVPVSNIEIYRTQSALFEFTLPENNVLEFQGITAPAGTTSQAVDAGVYLLIRPLSRQTTHTIRVRGTFDEFGATIDTTFRITVQ
jgi:hypothetical protein